jgi:hypothetical protein
MRGVEDSRRELDGSACHEQAGKDQECSQETAMRDRHGFWNFALKEFVVPREQGIAQIHLGSRSTTELFRLWSAR